MCGIYWASLKIMGRYSVHNNNNEKSIKQLNRVSIRVRFILQSGYIYGAVKGNSDAVYGIGKMKGRYLSKLYR